MPYDMSHFDIDFWCFFELAVAMSSYVVYEYEEDPGSSRYVKDEPSLEAASKPSAKVFHVHIRDADGAIQVAMTRPATEQRKRLDWAKSTTHSVGIGAWQFIRSSMFSFLRSLQTVFYRLVLPVGYPASVRTGYLRYQIYDSIQGLCSYLRNVLCAASMFEAAGVGDATATAWTAAIAWALRDGTGLLGSLVYTYLVSDQLDAHVKEFRLFADIINDVGFTLDMIAPWLGRNSVYYWYVSATSVLCKTMCGISAGATKGSITQHFAIHGNMADLNAKESTQETIVTLIGMVGGIYAAKYLQEYEQTHDSRVATWILFVVLTVVHVWANYQGVSLLRLRTINRSRIDQCMQEFYWSTVPQLLKDVASSDTTDFSTENGKRLIDATNSLLSSVLVSPENVQEIMYERLWQIMGILPKSRIRLDAPMTTLQPHFPNSMIGQALQQAHLASSRVLPDVVSAFRYNVTILKTKSNPHMVGVTLMTGADAVHELQAYVHAKIIMSLMETHNKQGSVQEWFDLSGRIMQLLFHSSDDRLWDVPLIIEALRSKDWDVDNGRFYLGFPPRRIQLVSRSTAMEIPEDVNESTKKIN
jgi:Vitamin B6 photo-protection and homoeostasis